MTSPAVLSSVLALFGLGPWEMALVFGVIVLLFGASRIPAMMRSLGKGVTEFKKGMQDGGKDEGEKKLPEPDESKKSGDK